MTGPGPRAAALARVRRCAAQVRRAEACLDEARARLAASVGAAEARAATEAEVALALGGPATQWYVRSDDGTDYRVGRWEDGAWLPGTAEDALREARLLRAGRDGEPGEPGAYAWGRAT